MGQYKVTTDHHFPDHIPPGSRYDATLPEPLRKLLLNEYSTPEIDGIEGSLRAYPALTWHELGAMRIEVSNRTIDIQPIVTNFLNNSEALFVLQGALRTADLTIGCVPRVNSNLCCSTCLADSPAYLRSLSAYSIQELLEDPRFISILQPSLRLGSGADPTDHPNVVQIAEKIINKFKSPPINRVLKITTTFRQSVASRLHRLADLAEAYPEHMKLSISRPLNITPEVSDALDGDPRLRAFAGQDVPLQHMDRGIAMQGRIIVPSHELMKNGAEPFIAAPPKHYGTGKPFLNADGVWLMLYFPMSSSHTTRGYIYLRRPEDLIRISRVIPYNPDFVATNWPAGNSSRVLQEAYGDGYDRTHNAKQPVYVES